MNEKLFCNIKKIQMQLLNIFHAAETYFKKYVSEGEESIKLFLKVAGILLSIVVLIKWLSVGTIIIVILLCSWIWVLNRNSTDIKKEEGRNDEENTENCNSS